MKTVKLKEVKKGDYFRFPGKKTVYVSGGFNRSSKKYDYNKEEDINATYSAKGDKDVEIDFEF